MFFKALTFFRFPVNFEGLFPAPVADVVSDAIDDLKLRPVGPVELSTRGFVSPFGRDSGAALAHRADDKLWLTLGGEDRLLPPAVINAELQKRLKAIELETGRSPGGRARRRVKEEVVAELLPRAFVQPVKLDAYLDFGRRFVACDTTSRSAAESLVSNLRHAIGTFPALPLSAQASPRAVLTGWLTGESLPDGFALGDECQLREASDDGARARFEQADLGSDEIVRCLEAGMQCTRLALTYNERVSFVISENLIIRKLKFLDGALEPLADQEHEDIRAELDARFYLMTAELGLLFDALAPALKLSEPDDAEQPTTAGVDHGAGDDTTTVTISGPGMAPITLTDRQLHDAAELITDINRAEALVRASGNASISRLQRQMKIGYNRAARLIEALEGRGVVTPPARGGDRTVIPPAGAVP